MKKIIVGLFVGVIAITTFNFVGAASLNDAVRTLPQNDEWYLMAHSSAGSNVGQNFLKEKISGASALDLEKRILAITAQGQNPRTFGKEDFVANLLSKFDGNQLGDSSLLNDDIFGLLALSSANISGEVLNKVRDHVQSNQNSDGGWGFARGGSSDSNMTAMAVAALRASGSSAPGNAITYLKNTQNEDGGYGYTQSASSDGASTAWVVIGLRSVRASIPQNAISFLESLQLSNGSFKWMPDDGNGSQLVTSYAVIALSGKSLPLRSVDAPAPEPAPTTAHTSPQPTHSQNPTPEPTPAQVTPSPTPAPLPDPNPAPLPAPMLTPAPLEAQLIETPSLPPNTYHVTITYPDNKIYVGNVSFSSTSLTSSNGLQYYYNTPRAIGTLIHAAQEINLLYEVKGMSFGPFVNTINGYAPVGSSGWQYAVNGTIPAQGAADYVLNSGDVVQWFFGPPNTQPY